MAAFQVFMYGRFSVFTEVSQLASALDAADPKSLEDSAASRIAANLRE
jgi:hypothetical protein